MNSKAIKRQLLAAIAMVLVAAIALGSSTYAWFASNNKVEAEGMKITATTEGANLEISLSNKFTAGTLAVTSTAVGETLLPTHYVTEADKGENGKYKDNTTTTKGTWAHAFSYEYDKVSGKDTYTNATKVDAVGTLGDSSSSTEWALVVPLYLRLNPQSKIQIKDIKATATITHANGATAETGATGMTTAGRVAFITDKTAKTVIGGQGYATGATSASLGNISKAGNAGMLTVYAVIYFDGDDASCTSKNFAADEYTVNLVFEGTMTQDAVTTA